VVSHTQLIESQVAEITGDIQADVDRAILTRTGKKQFTNATTTASSKEIKKGQNSLAKEGRLPSLLPPLTQKVTLQNLRKKRLQYVTSTIATLIYVTKFIM